LPGVELPKSKLEAELLVKRRSQLEERIPLPGYYLLLARFKELAGNFRLLDNWTNVGRTVPQADFRGVQALL